MSLFTRIRGRDEAGAAAGGEFLPARAPEQYAALKARIQDRLVKLVDARSLISSTGIPEAQRADIKRKIVTLLEEDDGVPPTDRDAVAERLYAEIIGYGPIQELLEDPEVDEIMVNSAASVYVERHGRIEPTAIRFPDDRDVLMLIDKIVTPLGRRIDESCPMVDARLPDGSRVNAVIPPLAVNGPCITIRKFASRPLTIDDLVRLGTLTREMAEFIEACVRARVNIVVSGGTGSGKTTTLNVLSSFIPGDERIITIEDAAELQLRQEHVVSLETRPPNIEGRGEITVRHLVRNALRMRPDRIVVGEVRGGEALDMLQAMNTGHDGSLTTGHANSPRDMLSRLETMVLMAGVDLPVKAIREQIASAVDLIIHQSRMKDGSRKITSVVEVQGMEGDCIVLQDIFVYRQTGYSRESGVAGRFAATGIRPRLAERIEAAGIALNPGIFSPEHDEPAVGAAGTLQRMRPRYRP